MAIDSNDKKASLLNIGTPFYVLGPLVSGAFGQGEIQHLLHLYTGILVGASPSTVVSDISYSTREIVRFQIGSAL